MKKIKFSQVPVGHYFCTGKTLKKEYVWLKLTEYSASNWRGSEWPIYVDEEVYTLKN